MPPQSKTNAPLPTGLVKQEYSQMGVDDANGASSFLRIQSPTGNHTNSLLNQHKVNAGSFGTYDSVHNQTNSVSNNPVCFDALFHQTQMVRKYIFGFISFSNLSLMTIVTNVTAAKRM